MVSRASAVGCHPLRKVPLPEKEEVDRGVLLGDRSPSSYRVFMGAGSLHLREAVEPDKSGRRFAGPDPNHHRPAAMGMSLRQGGDDVGGDGQAKREAAARVGGDGALCARGGVAGG
jgi:hypothetical protein